MKALGGRYKMGDKFEFKKIEKYDEFITNQKKYKIFYDYEIGKTKILSVPVENTSNTVSQDKKFLVLMTMFYKETEDELNYFYNFYRKQGVEKFFMYYNGKLSEKDLPKHLDVEYIEWDFVYWHYLIDRENQVKQLHHAQIPAMTTFYYKHSHNYNYCIFCDTDEFIVVNEGKTTLSNHLKTFGQRLDTLWYPNVFCFLNKNENQIFYNTPTNNNLYTDTSRSKCIISGLSFHSFFNKNESTLPVHGMSGVHHVNPDMNGIMYHAKLKSRDGLHNVFCI